MRCLYCNKYLRNKKENARYCSTRCRVADHRKKKRYTSVTENSDKTILSLCDFSGNWCRPYRETGYNVIQVDLQHGQDIRLMKLPDKPVYGILAAPPCTCFASSGSCHKRTEAEMIEALSVVDACLRFVAISKPAFWAIENPVGTLRHYLGPPAYYFQPCDFGDPYTKKTCLWGEFNKPAPVNQVTVNDIQSGHHSIDHYWKKQGKSLGKNRQALRSVTPEGFAQAFYEVNR